jgi:hypothetical protein
LEKRVRGSGAHLHERASVAPYALYSFGIKCAFNLLAAFKCHPNVPLFGNKYTRKEDFFEFELHGVGQQCVASARKLAHAIKGVMQHVLLMLLREVVAAMVVSFGEHVHEHAVCVAVYNAQLRRGQRVARSSGSQPCG